MPAAEKTTLFIAGELPPGQTAATLALGAFILVICWLGASLGYLTASLRQLRVYRAHLPQHYSNLDRRDLQWVDWVMVLLAMLWSAAAVSLAADILGYGPLLPNAVPYGLTACCLLFFTVFATQTPPRQDSQPPSEPPDNKIRAIRPVAGSR